MSLGELFFCVFYFIVLLLDSPKYSLKVRCERYKHATFVCLCEIALGMVVKKLGEKKNVVKSRFSRPLNYCTIIKFHVLTLSTKFGKFYSIKPWFMKHKPPLSLSLTYVWVSLPDFYLFSCQTLLGSENFSLSKALYMNECVWMSACLFYRKNDIMFPFDCWFMLNSTVTHIWKSLGITLW